MSRPRGAPTSFGLQGGGRGTGHIGKLRGQRGQDEFPNRLQWRRVGARGVPRSGAHAPPHPHAHTAARTSKIIQAGPQAGPEGGGRQGEGLPQKKTSDTQENGQHKTKEHAVSQSPASEQQPGGCPQRIACVQGRDGGFFPVCGGPVPHPGYFGWGSSYFLRLALYPET